MGFASFLFQIAFGQCNLMPWSNALVDMATAPYLRKQFHSVYLLMSENQTNRLDNRGIGHMKINPQGEKVELKASVMKAVILSSSITQ